MPPLNSVLGNMERKVIIMHKWVLLIAVTVIMAALAGCLGDEGGSEGEEAPELVQKHGTIEPQSGWIDDDGNGNSANGQYTVNLNNTNIIIVTISVVIEDSDAEHQETDQGSDPDEVTVTVSGGNETNELRGTTPFRREFEFKAKAGPEGGDYLAQSWTITIDAALGGGKPAYFFGFIVWEDQGVAYTIEGEYTYMAPEIA